MIHDRKVVPFRVWHYEWLETGMPISEQELNQMERQNSWTLVVDGSIIACMGTMFCWIGRHHAWAYMKPTTGQHMRWITNEVLKNLQRLQGRIEMTVKTDFAAGHRWAKMLGFDLETPLMRAYGPDGSDHALYVRFN